MVPEEWGCCHRPAPAPSPQRCDLSLFILAIFSLFSEPALKTLTQASLPLTSEDVLAESGLPGLDRCRLSAVMSLFASPKLRYTQRWKLGLPQLEILHPHSQPAALLPSGEGGMGAEDGRAWVLSLTGLSSDILQTEACCKGLCYDNSQGTV